MALSLIVQGGVFREALVLLVPYNPQDHDLIACATDPTKSSDYQITTSHFLWLAGDVTLEEMSDFQDSCRAMDMSRGGASRNLDKQKIIAEVSCRGLDLSGACRKS
jgi:hypothetical protein